MPACQAALQHLCRGHRRAETAYIITTHPVRRKTNTDSFTALLKAISRMTSKDVQDTEYQDAEFALAEYKERGNTCNPEYLSAYTAKERDTGYIMYTREEISLMPKAVQAMYRAERAAGKASGNHSGSGAGGKDGGMRTDAGCMHIFPFRMYGRMYYTWFNLPGCSLQEQSENFGLMKKRLLLHLAVYARNEAMEDKEARKALKACCARAGKEKQQQTGCTACEGAGITETGITGASTAEASITADSTAEASTAGASITRDNITAADITETGIAGAGTTATGAAGANSTRDNITAADITGAGMADAITGTSAGATADDTAPVANTAAAANAKPAAHAKHAVRGKHRKSAEQPAESSLLPLEALSHRAEDLSSLPSFREFSCDWLDEIYDGCSEEQIADCEDALKDLLPVFGERRLDRVSTDDIDSLLMSLTDVYCYREAQIVRDVLERIYDFANVCKGLRSPMEDAMIIYAPEDIDGSGINYIPVWCRTEVASSYRYIKPAHATR